MQKNIPKVPLMAYMSVCGQRSEASFRLRFVTILAHMMLRDQQMRRASSRLLIESISQSKPPHASKIWKRRIESLPEAKWAVGTSNALEQPLLAVMQGPRDREFLQISQALKVHSGERAYQVGHMLRVGGDGRGVEFLRFTFIVVLVANETAA
jgi:hypothetical protein